MRTFFTEIGHYKKKDRQELHPFLKPFFKKSFQDELNEIYGNWIRNFEITTDPEEADFFVLALSWNFYYRNRKSDALSFIEKVKSYDKSIYAWTSGDFGVKPMDDTIITLRPSGYQSKKSDNEFGMPIFFRDPLVQWLGKTHISLREKSIKPTIGFCGYTSNNPLKWLKQTSSTIISNTKNALGLNYEQPQSVFSPLYLRNKILNTIKKSVGLESNFILRDRYRAGAITEKARANTKMEYLENLQNSDYIICVRGSGNFSVRLYETLAMGRIPVFINTDCILPKLKGTDWSKHVVWVEVNNLEHVNEAILDFHGPLTRDDFREIQFKNRKLWEEQLSQNFWTNTFQEVLLNHY